MIGASRDPAEAVEAWLRRQLDGEGRCVMPRRPHRPKPSDHVMFPWASDAMTPKLIVWAALTHFPEGATPADVAGHLLRWGLAEGERTAVETRVTQFFENLAAAPPGSRGATQMASGRYKAVLRQPSSPRSAR